MARTSRAAAGAGEWRHAALVASLFAAVFGTLLIGAVFEIDDPGADPHDAARPGVIDDTGSAAATAPVETAPQIVTPLEARTRPFTADESATEATSPLDERAATDERRLAGDPSDWTLQFLMACDPGNVRSLLDRLGGETELFVLRKQHDDRICYRICWGRYPSRASARAARDVPSSLTEIPGGGRPVPVNSVLP